MSIKPNIQPEKRLEIWRPGWKNQYPPAFQGHFLAIWPIFTLPFLFAKPEKPYKKGSLSIAFPWKMANQHPTRKFPRKGGLDLFKPRHDLEDSSHQSS